MRYVPSLMLLAFLFLYAGGAAYAQETPQTKPIPGIQCKDAHTAELLAYAFQESPALTDAIFKTIDAAYHSPMASAPLPCQRIQFQGTLMPPFEKKEFIREGRTVRVGAFEGIEPSQSHVYIVIWGKLAGWHI